MMWASIRLAILTLALATQTSAETLKLASPQRGSWEGAVPKLGQCPANWTQSGNYCLAPEGRR